MVHRQTISSYCRKSIIELHLDGILSDDSEEYSDGHQQDSCFLFREIVLYLTSGRYPDNFRKSDKQVL